MDKLNKLFLVLAAIGIAISIYHAYDELTSYSSQISTVCNINSHVSCAGVFESGHTSILGVPFYVLGLIWFPLMLVLGLWFTRGGKESNSVYLLVPLLMIGNAFTIYLWYLELVVIGIVCPVCMSLYVINYIMTAICVAAILRQQ